MKGFGLCGFRVQFLGYSRTLSPEPDSHTARRQVQAAIVVAREHSQSHVVVLSTPKPYT